MDAPKSADALQDASAGLAGAEYGSNGGAGDSDTSVTGEGAPGGGVVEVSGVVEEAEAGAVGELEGGAAEWEGVRRFK